MPIAYKEHLHKSTRRHGYHDEGWSRSRSEEQRARHWKAYDPACLLEWKEPSCDEGFFPSSKEQSIALNTKIDEIYDQLAVLVAKRNSTKPDSGLEDQITQLFQRLRMLQKQEGNLIRAMLSSTRTSNVETGLAILKRMEQLRIKYGDTATTNPTAQGPNTTEA